MGAVLSVLRLRVQGWSEASPASMPAIHVMAGVARRGVVMLGVTAVASVPALLERMIERPARTDGMTGITRGGVSARGMAGRALGGVAAQAGSRCHATMVVHSGCPGGGVVATVARHRDFRTRVAEWPACSGRPIVAGCAAAGSDTDMVVSRRNPGVGLVALVAGQRSAQPAVGRGFVGGGHAVVASRA